MNAWETKTLGGLCSKITDGTHLRPKYTETGIPFLSVKNLTKGVIDFSNTKFISEEDHKALTKRSKPEIQDVLYTKVGTTGVAKVIDTNREFSIFVSVALLKIKHEVIFNRYLEHFLNSKIGRDQARQRTRGMANKNLVIKDIKEIIVSYPINLAEQKQIVAIVDHAFEGIDRAIANTEKNLTNARELFESYLNAILSGKGKQWKETTLGKEIDLLTGFAFKSSGYTDSDKSIRLLRGDNITPGLLRWDGVKRWLESEVDEYLPYRLQEGDVVLAMDRPWIKTGLRRAQISKDDLPCLLVQRTACLRGGDNLENRFLLYLISGRSFTQHVLGSQIGLSVPHISGKQIQSFKFNKPHIKDQYSIVDSLDELRLETQRLEAIYRRKLAALNELKQSILQEAFTGELTADTATQTTKAAKEVIAA